MFQLPSSQKSTLNRQLKQPIDVGVAIAFHNLGGAYESLEKQNRLGYGQFARHWSRDRPAVCATGRKGSSARQGYVTRWLSCRRAKTTGSRNCDRVGISDTCPDRDSVINWYGERPPLPTREPERAGFARAPARSCCPRPGYPFQDLRWKSETAGRSCLPGNAPLLRLGAG